MKELKTHWVADMYPLNEDDVAALAEDIKANGQIAPIKALKDGRIIDGRNRFRACQKAGIEPLIEVINPDGEEVSDERLFALATSCNSMRRDMTTSLRACLAAEAWKKLFPEGNAPGQGRKKEGQIKSKIGLNFEEFAYSSFKVGKTYAKQALAIANHDPSGELLGQAKGSLSDAYRIYEQEKIQRAKERENREILERHPDLQEQVANGMSVSEALVLARHRESDRIQKEDAEKRRKAAIVEAVRAFQQMIYMNPEMDGEEVRDWMDYAQFAGTFEGMEAERLTLQGGITLLSNILQATK
jgi:hypothetical protein